MKRAIDTINQVKKLYNPLYIFDNIIYNRDFVNQLLNNNKTIIKANTLDDIPDGAVIISSAYGIEAPILQAAEQRDMTVINIVCPFISDIQMQIKNLSKLGYSIIIIGESANQECITLASYANNVYIINSLLDVDLLPDFSQKQVAYFSQSSICEMHANTIINKLKSRIPTIVDKLSICPVMIKRQQEIKDISTMTECIIVVGDSESCSTKSLIQTAQLCNINKIINIQTPHDLNIEHDLQNISKFAITSGIDVSSEFVQEVIGKLQSAYDINLINKSIEEISTKIEDEKDL